MIVQNRKSLVISEITKDEWQKIKERKIHSLFKVIDDSDLKKGKIPIPKEIIEYQKSPKSLKIEPITQTIKSKQPE